MDPDEDNRAIPFFSDDYSANAFPLATNSNSQTATTSTFPPAAINVDDSYNPAEIMPGNESPGTQAFLSTTDWNVIYDAPTETPSTFFLGDADGLHPADMYASKPIEPVAVAGDAAALFGGDPLAPPSNSTFSSLQQSSGGTQIMSEDLQTADYLFGASSGGGWGGEDIFNTIGVASVPDPVATYASYSSSSGPTTTYTASTDYAATSGSSKTSHYGVPPVSDNYGAFDAVPSDVFAANATQKFDPSSFVNTTGGFELPSGDDYGAQKETFEAVASTKVSTLSQPSPTKKPSNTFVGEPVDAVIDAFATTTDVSAFDAAAFNTTSNLEDALQPPTSYDPNVDYTKQVVDYSTSFQYSTDSYTFQSSSYQYEAGVYEGGQGGIGGVDSAALGVSESVADESAPVLNFQEPPVSVQQTYTTDAVAAKQAMAEKSVLHAASIESAQLGANGLSADDLDKDALDDMILGGTSPSFIPEVEQTAAYYDEQTEVTGEKTPIPFNEADDKTPSASTFFEQKVSLSNKSETASAVAEEPSATAFFQGGEGGDNSFFDQVGTTGAAVGASFFEQSASDGFETQASATVEGAYFSKHDYVEETAHAVQGAYSVQPSAEEAYFPQDVQPNNSFGGYNQQSGYTDQISIANPPPRGASFFDQAPAVTESDPTSSYPYATESPSSVEPANQDHLAQGESLPSSYFGKTSAPFPGQADHGAPATAVPPRVGTPAASGVVAPAKGTSLGLQSSDAYMNYVPQESKNASSYTTPPPTASYVPSTPPIAHSFVSTPQTSAPPMQPYIPSRATVNAVQAAPPKFPEETKPKPASHIDTNVPAHSSLMSPQSTNSDKTVTNALVNGHVKNAAPFYAQYGETVTSNTYASPAFKAIQGQDDDRSSVYSMRSSITDMRQCPHCKKYNDPDANFCSKCGNNISAVPALSSRSQTPMPSYTPDVPGRSMSPAGSLAAARESHYSAAQRSSAPMPYPSYTNNASDGGSDIVPRSQSAPYFPTVQTFQDPLGRRGCPLVRFGYGGKLIVMFTRKSQRYSQVQGGVLATEKVYPGLLQIHSMKKILSSQCPDLAHSLVSFPGPGVKNRKKEMLKWLEGLIKAEESGLSGTALYPLAMLLKLALESDGKLFSSNDFASIVVSKILGINENAYLEPVSLELQPASSSALQQVSALLIVGKRKEAVDAAVASHLWAHALIIAGHVDKSTYDGVIKSFVTQNMSVVDPVHSLFNLFSGDFTFSGHVDWSRIWQQHLAILLSNRTANDQAAICNFGNALINQNLFGPGHLCFLISGVGFGGVDSGNPLVLLSSNHHQQPGTFYKDVMAVQLTECFEFIQTLQSSDFVLPHFQAYRLAHSRLLCDLGFTEESEKVCEAVVNVLKTYSKKSPYFHRQFAEALREMSALTAAHLGTSGETKDSFSRLTKGIFDVFDRGISKFIGADADASPTDKSSTKTKSLAGFNGPTVTDVTPSAMSSSSVVASAEPSVGSNYPYGNSGYPYGSVQQQSTYPYGADQQQQASYPYGSDQQQQSTQSTYPYSAGEQQQPSYPYGADQQQQATYPYGAEQQPQASYPYGSDQQHASYPYGADQTQSMYPNDAETQLSPYHYGNDQQQSSYPNGTDSVYPNAQSTSGYANPYASSTEYSSYGGYNPYAQAPTSSDGGAVENLQTAPQQMQNTPDDLNYAQNGYRADSYGNYQSSQHQAAIGTTTASSGIDTIPSSKGMKLPGDDLDDDGLGLDNSALSKQKRRNTESDASTKPQPEDKKAEDQQQVPDENSKGYMSFLRGLSWSLIRQSSTSSAGDRTSTGSTGGPVKAKLGDSGGFHYDPAQGKWVMSGAKADESRSSTPAAPPMDPQANAMPTAPPSTPNVRSNMTSRAASPAPIPGGGLTDPMAGAPLNRRSTGRKSTRSRYVDTFNPDSNNSSENRRTSTSFLPSPNVAVSSGAVPRIMTPGPGPYNRQSAPEGGQ